MRKTEILVILFFLTSLISHPQIIADHTIIDRWDDIPEYYINEVKKMLLIPAGESHTNGILGGLALLESLNPNYNYDQGDGVGGPDLYTTTKLRAERVFWGDFSNSTGWVTMYGEEDWFTNSIAVNRTKAGITYINEDYGTVISALGFGWCWDMFGASSTVIDPLYGCHWFGTTLNGPDGAKPWGLDATDQAITGNSVSMDTYLSATQDYIDYCTVKGYPTKVYFATGPCDQYGSAEERYQAYIKYEHIRNYVKADPNRILFDYADILCYNDDGSVGSETWNGYIFPWGTLLNTSPEQVGHISNAGALRLGKAMWWMLARIAGWDGNVAVVPVTSITVAGAGGSTTITQDNGTLALTATVQPTNATNKTVTWSIINGTGQATISTTGVVTAVSNGTVTARATATDGSGVYGQLVITISGQIIPVTGITVTGAGGSSMITTDGGQLQLTATVTPSDATNKTVTWSIVNGTGQATISTTGVVTAVANGTVTARATATDGSGVYGQLVITISGQIIPVTGITVTGAGGSSVIATDGGQLQLTATVTPSDATNKTVFWSIVNGTGQATINTTGLVTAVSSGTVTAIATANDGSGLQGTLVITITNQLIPVTSITVTGAGGATTITQDNGTLALTATVQPTNATNKAVTWSIINGTGQATISTTGVVTAVANGTVTARATATDGSGVYGQLVITISGQIIPVTGITVTGAGGSSIITTDGGQLQLTATVIPSDATNKTVTWSIVNGTGQATINTTGLVTAVSSGTVTAIATANDGSGVQGNLVITITNQFIPVTSITVTRAGGATTITQDNGTLALTATVLPTNATNKTVTWSIINGTGQATISTTGVVTAVANGTVTARATATDGSGVYGQLVITISGQVIPVTGITVTGAGGSSVITTDGGQLQLTATVTPSDATNKTVTWSIVNGTGQATINTSGLVTAVSSGTVTAVATANDGSGVQGSLVITITNQFIPVTSIAVTGAGGATTITQDNGTLALTATVQPTNATNKTVTWSIINGTGQATISTTGVVTAIANGTVTARATATDGSGVYGQLVITISGQVIPVTGITVTGAGGSSVITTDGGQLQLTATVTPSDATNKTVTWSIVNGTGQATINTTGLVTAVSSGTVTAVATANDGSGVQSTLVITITNQFISVTSITVTGAGGATTITQVNGTLALTATVQPTNATNKTVTWSIVNGTGQATISTTGVVTAVTNGTVTARATATDGTGIYGQLVITISGQVIPVTRIEIASSKGEAIISTANGTLQLSATVVPANATNQSVSWSVINITGQAIISSSGLVTAIANGTVTARATANDGSGVFGELAITITNQFVAVAGISVTGVGGINTIDMDDGTLQMEATVSPANSTIKTVSWSVVNITGVAEINNSGLLTGISPGEVLVVATANDGSGVSGELTVLVELVESISIRYNRNELVIQVPERLIPAKASLHNLYGSHLQSKVIDSSECIFDIAGLLPGIYVVTVYNSVVQDAVKIVISY